MPAGGRPRAAPPRSGSANTTALATLAALAPAPVTPVFYDGLTKLPAFNPDHDGDLLGKPVAWVNVGASGRGSGAVAALASVLGYGGAAIVSEACRDIAVGRSTVGIDGTVDDRRFATAVAEIWRALLARLAVEWR